jgi:hypothetical protein
MIWFADSLSAWALESSGGWLTAGNADTALRIAGWLILLVMLVPRAIAILEAMGEIS